MFKSIFKFIIIKLKILFQYIFLARVKYLEFDYLHFITSENCNAIFLSLCEMSMNVIAFRALMEELVKITLEGTTAHAHMDMLAYTATVSDEMGYIPAFVAFIGA